MSVTNNFLPYQFWYKTNYLFMLFIVLPKGTQSNLPSSSSNGDFQDACRIKFIYCETA